MKDPVDHILRPLLPWRTGDGAITECGYNASKVKTLTREEAVSRFKEFGRQRFAMFTCMTCMETAERWQSAAQKIMEAANGGDLYAATWAMYNALFLDFRLDMSQPPMD